MDQKASQLLDEIDLARCRAQWSTCLELSKKYKKFKPNDSVLDTTISTEVELIQLLKSSSDIEKRGWDVIHQHDDPFHISLLPSVSPKKVAHLLKRLDFLDQQTEDNNWQTQFSKILLARIYFESGQYDLALSALQNLALRIEDVQAGYGLVLLVQARAMKGICLEQNENYEGAIEAYQAAWDAVELQPQERGVMLSFWIEECLYRGILLRLRLNHPVKETIGMMRAYVQLVSSHWSPHWRMFRRWVILKYHADYLVKIYQDDTYIPSIKNSAKLPDEMAAFEELSTLLNLFRHLYTIITPYLDSTSKSEYGLLLAHIMMTSHDIVGWGETAHIRRVLQYLYQVKNATFNNATINRYMFFTLLKLGSLEEAKLALRAYLDLMGVPDFDSGIVHDDIPTEVTINPEEKDSATDLTRPLATKTKAHCIIQRLADCENESIDSIVSVILAGIQFYGHEEQNGSLSAYLSDLALDVILESQVTTHLSEVYRARGSCYGLLAAQSEEYDQRSAHHQESIQSLHKAIDINNSCWKSYYVLGFQQAVMRDTHASVLSISKSIELNPHHVDSWHLLALLYSCKRTDDLPKAYKTLEAGLQLSTRNFISANGLPVFSWNEQEVNANDIYRQAESYFSLRMSQITIKEAMEGPESVMDQYEELFQSYTQLTQQLGISNSEDIPASPTTTTTTTTNRRRRKSSLSLIRRTSLTSIANSISSSVSTGTSTRRRASSVEETNKNRPTFSRKAESDTDDFSDDSSNTTMTRKASRRRQGTSISSSTATPPPPPTAASSIHRSNSAITQTDADMKKRSLQLIDLGLARRIGTAAASPAQHNGKHQDSSKSLVGENSTSSKSTAAVSLASMLAPSYSMGSLRSHSMSSRSSSIVNTASTKAVARDGLVVSTFHQHHQAYEIRQRIRWQSLLVTLWLMSTKTFIKAGLLEEANKALGEAEQLGLGDPGVWYQLGQLSVKAREVIELKKKKTLDDVKAIKEMNQVSSDSFEKALILDPEHVPSQVSKAIRLYEANQVELADGLLEQITRGLGWDSAEAWYQHAKLKANEGSLDRAKTCFLFALELNDTEPIRNLNILTRFI